ncbi:hypothetical protein AKJ18_19775 [Vibrio xuii]|nr:hypothetical protein AKJ18_19775 [Vibrio xuii]
MPKSKIDILKNNDAVLVHCASATKMVGDQQTNILSYMDRITFVLNNFPAISCSTVVFGDVVVDNYSGALGVVLKPNANDSIIYSSQNDVGTTPEQRNNGIGKYVSTDQEFESAIQGRQRQAYNEIIVHDYTCLGVFVEDIVQFTDHNNGKLIHLSHADIYKHFGNVNYFLLEKGLFYLAVYNQNTNVFEKSSVTKYVFY